MFYGAEQKRTVDSAIYTYLVNLCCAGTLCPVVSRVDIPISGECDCIIYFPADDWDL